MTKPKASKPSRMPKKPAEIAKPVPASPPAPVAETPKSPAAKAAPHLYGRLLGIMRARGADYPTQSAEDFAAYAFSGLKPEGTAEVLLCAQMVACWETWMAMLSGAKLADDYQAMTEKGALAVKLLSVFERQFATLTKARKPPQVVTVEHVHKHLHVNAPGPTGDATIIQGQPYEPTTPRSPRTCSSTRDAWRDAGSRMLYAKPLRCRTVVAAFTAEPLQAPQAVSATDPGSMVDTVRSRSSCAAPCGRCYVRPARRCQRGRKEQPQAGGLGLQVSLIV
jgi:hypothetical protein